MSNNKFTGYICWDKQSISKVINKEAISISRDLFLATHTPFNSIHYHDSPRKIKDSSETQLLEELLTRSINNEHTFIVMQGIQGTGKSHLVRWLKERYAVENDERNGTDVVLLIERANSSLRQTLLQIVNSNLFQAERFATQIKKLESATQQLSNDSISEVILDNLRIATKESNISAPRRIEGKIANFLLDPSVRKELKREKGAIERIRLFLSGNSGNMGLGENEFPKFQAEDFNFRSTVKRNILAEGGHRDAKDLTETLGIKPQKRHELADYLNKLLPFAIQRTTALSSSDLKQMFYDLRRELKQQNKNLVLFIEDISVFTGLDAGLVDVLVTQHTGEGGREFCRLISVVGITDAYYRDSFPDNIKDRITHHLTLNLSEGQKESLLLKDAGSVANLTARYLNALRLNQSEIEQWVRSGAKPEELPNACLGCPHNGTCHNAFGFSQLGESNDEKLQIGLYPFNHTSLWTFYRGLDTTKAAKTPRTFLGSILEYILQSHTTKIKASEFPPPVHEITNSVIPPTLKQNTQRRLITTQTRSTKVADRIESLILYWGDRTVNREVANDTTTVGNLKEAVFHAFDLPFIKGDDSSTSTTNVSFVTPKPASISSSLTTSLQIDKTPTYEINPTTKQSTSDPIIKDIQEWRRGGMLANYSDLSKWLADYAREYIDWEAYGISLTLVDFKITGRRFVIKGQKGQRARGDHLIFKRNDDLAFVLQALAEIRQRSESLTATEIGGHLITLSNWMEREKARIIKFARQPSANQESPRPLLDLLVHTNLLLSCLSEELIPSKSSSREIYLRLMKTSAKRNSWEALKTRSPYPRSSNWRELMRGLQNLESDCREQLEILVNCRQGISRNITFIDAASVLDSISSIKKDNWDVPELSLHEIAQSSNKAWKPAATAFSKLQTYFLSTLQIEVQHVQDVLDRLRMFLADARPKEVFETINSLLETFRTNSIPISTSRFTIEENLTYRKLSNRLENLQSILGSEDTENMILSLSSAGEVLQEAIAYINYFEKFVTILNQEEDKLNDRLADLESSSQNENLYQQTLKQYQALEELLDTTLIGKGENTYDN